MKNPILVTGCAGFIGFHLCQRLLNEGLAVVGIDNLNNYYDVSLKQDRLSILKKDKSFTFIKCSVENLELLESLFDRYSFNIVLHFAAQAGVRYSITHPHGYIQSNLVGFTNMLECCRKFNVSSLIYASSSSVYGQNKQLPFSITDRVDTPISLYAATKRANELLAYTYSHLYNLPTTGLRLFTVYGPWGRPDMAIFNFTNLILKKEPIEIYNNGYMKRDFTYIDDCIESVYRLVKKGPPRDIHPPYKIYNIGSHQPVQLLDCIDLIETHLGDKAIKRFLPLQPGDVPETFADIDDLTMDIHYKPRVSIDEGIKRFIKWFKDYYQIK